MRIKQMHVQDNKLLKEYAYYEDCNSNWRKQMEDNFLLAENINHQSVSLFGILDGHGGAHISEYCSQQIPILVQKYINQEPKQGKTIFDRVFATIDQQLHAEDLEAGEVGTTCCLALLEQFQNKRFCRVANLGDTRAIICSDKEIAKRVTIDHKVSNPSETDRIKGEGGTIIKGRVGGQLAITRALGDLELKPYGVSNIPDYQEFQINDQIHYMIIASDGLWDVCEDQQAVQICKKCNNSLEMTHALLHFAITNGSRDNISVFVLKF